MSQRCLLIIDDDYRIREVTKVSLEMTASWNIVTASSGKEGIHLAKIAQPDGILLDIMMPGLDGFLTLETLKADPLTQDIPIILLTAKAHIYEDETLGGKQYVGLIQKPFNALELHHLISKLFDWPS